MTLFQKKILAWYSDEKRDLPWRDTTDPYKILVSEIMLQQTQVSRVLPIYTAFIQRFPTIEALAQAALGDVLKAWKGLGYNRRAKYLWLAAKASNDVLPATEEELRKLPGIGPYTAAAVMAFAHNTDSVPVDTNIRRIYHRCFRDTSEERIAKTLPKGRARDWNNALMDFGSLVCTKNPVCTACPLRKECKAYKEQDFSVPVQKQSAFKESNRFYRGRILDVLRSGPKTKQQLQSIGDTTKVEQALTQLVTEAFVKKEGKHYTL